MSHPLSPVDVAIVAFYLVATIILGAWFTRRQRNVRTYFVGDRNISWWLVLISIVATETSTVTFLSVPGLAYANGGNLTFLQLAFGYVIGRVLIAWLLLPQYLRGEMLSAYQVLRERFDVKVQRTASGLFLLTRAAADGLRLYLAATLLFAFTHWDMRISILVIGAACMIYTYLGGMHAVIWTDLIQFLIYISGAVLAGVCLLQLLPGGLQEYVQAGEADGKFRLFDFRFDPTVNFTLWTGLIGGSLFTMASHGADQMMVQRYLCSRSLGQARAALVLSGVVVLLQFLLFLLLGVGLYVLAQAGLLYSDHPLTNDQVFGQFIVTSLPHGLVGVVIASVLAAAMSTLASSLSSAASASVADFYQPLRPGRSDRHYLFVSRVLTAFWGLTRIAVALAAQHWLSTQSIVNEVLRVAGFTTGMILGLFLLGRMARPVGSAAALTGVVAGFLVVGAVWLPSLWSKAALAWPWYAPIGTLTTVLIAAIVDKISRGARRERGE
ncbi:MAG: sodium/solute symporter [Planctomycetota bacterium]|nr:MAG: sodium/solute symporter [Planctomycetota bacterium]